MESGQTSSTSLVNLAGSLEEGPSLHLACSAEEGLSLHLGSMEKKTIFASGLFNGGGTVIFSSGFYGGMIFTSGRFKGGGSIFHHRSRIRKGNGTPEH